MADLKSTLQALVADVNKASFYDLAEMQVQSDYVLKVLEALGWESRDWKLGQSQEVDTGKMPDIVLHDKNGYAVFVMDCKDASGPRKLDGSYFSGKARKSFVDKLFDYCEAEGIYWGMLTNFVEWRLYSVQQRRLYQDKKFAIHALLWPKAERRDYVDLLSEEGLEFLSLFQRKEFCERKGKVDTDPVYYPQEEEIKEQFFARLRAWRGLLRSELFQCYGERFEKQEIDLFTQKILDRVIFMDVCHDKGIIGPDHLRAILHSKGSKYGELKHRFRDMDERFNTELFMPHEIDRFEVSDETLIPILNELILTDFSRISVHIIGEVYENYLGEILRVSKKKGLRVQEHKEQAKRKEHGIYYTPEYIVDYIVKNTLGELLKGVQTEKELRQIRVLDPACGSGSFLIRAFDLFYEAYHGIREKGQLAAFKDFEIKKAILQNNLFGVDLDDRAVEIAKLNLMLKALEGVIWEELKGRKLLPNLNLNIRCGNSLISGHRLEEQYEGELALGDRFDREIGELVKLRKQFYKETEDEGKEALLKQIRRDEEVLNHKLNRNLKGFFNAPNELKPLNYQVAFPDVFQKGGFDVVIGNPPYGYMIPKDQQAYFLRTRKHQDYQQDLYLLFLERYKSLIKPGGLLGVIVSNTWLQSVRLKKIRKHLANEYRWKRVLLLPEKVFDAVVDTHVLVFEKGEFDRKSDSRFAVDIRKGDDIALSHVRSQASLNLNGDPINVVAKEATKEFLDRITRNTKRLKDFCDVYNGVKPFEVGKGNPPQTKEILRDKPFVKEGKKPGKGWLPLLRGSLINRYVNLWDEDYWILYGERLAAPREAEIFSCDEKIMVRQTGDSLIATIIGSGYIARNNIHIVIPKDKSVNQKFLLGILNSKLLDFIYTYLNPEKGEALAEVKKEHLELLPIPIIDKGNKGMKSIHDEMVALVKEMLALNKSLESRRKNEDRISALEKEIDGLVFRLYGLTAKEIGAIGGSGS